MTDNNDGKIDGDTEDDTDGDSTDEDSTDESNSKNISQNDADDKNSETDEQRDIFIVPTSHASEKSSQDVKDAVSRYKPELIAIELDQNRLKRLKQDSLNSDDDKSIKDLIGNTKNIGLKGRIVLILFSMMQSNIAEKLGIDLLGLDMLAGYEASVENEIPLALVDKDMNETFNRFSDEVSTKEALGSVLKFLVAYIQISRMSEEEIDEGLGKETEDIDIEEAIEAMEEAFPTFKSVLIDDRNQHIADSTYEASRQFGDAVLVIGAAHKKGVISILSEKENVNVYDTTDDELEQVEE